MTLDLKNEAKEIRDQIKKDFNTLNIGYTSKEANEDIASMYGILEELRKLIIEFSTKYV